MQCKNHADVPAVDRCVGCAEAFCGDCLVEVLGQKYCGSCKVLAIQGRQVAVVEEDTVPCKEANEALTYSIVALFCFGVILGPVAIHKAYKAKQIIAEDPRLSGFGKANAAMVIGIVAMVLSVIFIIGRANRTARSM
jgi:hypothetical protein